jgi:hypothetical protein
MDRRDRHDDRQLIAEPARAASSAEPMQAATVLAALRQAAGCSLIPAIWVDAWRRAVEPLPACAEAIGFECRLNGAGAIDLGLAIPRLPGGTSLATISIDALGERWGPLRRFAEGWARADSPLAGRMPVLFLEFDGAADAVGALPLPSMFCGLDWPVDELIGRQRAASRRAGRLLAATLEGLRGARFDRVLQRAALRAVAALPRGGVLLHVGVMLGRPGAGLRFSVLVPRFRAEAYLQAIGRDDVARGAVDAIERYSARGGFPTSGSHVQLDFDPGGSDRRLGVTVRPVVDDGWAPLVLQLVDSGVCSPESGAALLRWRGSMLAPVVPDGVPVRLARRIEHVKLVCDSTGLTGAKAYCTAAAVPSGRG